MGFGEVPVGGMGFGEVPVGGMGLERDFSPLQ